MDGGGGNRQEILGCYVVLAARSGSLELRRGVVLLKSRVDERIEQGCNLPRLGRECARCMEHRHDSTFCKIA